MFYQMLKNSCKTDEQQGRKRLFAIFNIGNFSPVYNKNDKWNIMNTIGLGKVVGVLGNEDTGGVLETGRSSLCF